MPAKLTTKKARTDTQQTAVIDAELMACLEDLFKTVPEPVSSARAAVMDAVLDGASILGDDEYSAISMQGMVDRKNDKSLAWAMRESMADMWESPEDQEARDLAEAIARSMQDDGLLLPAGFGSDSTTPMEEDECVGPAPRMSIMLEGGEMMEVDAETFATIQASLAADRDLM